MNITDISLRSALRNLATAAALLSATLPANALVISGAFDQSIANAPNSAAIQSEINSALNIYQSLFQDPFQVSILFRYSTTTPNGTALESGVLAQSNYTAYLRPYSTFINALNNDATTAADFQAIANLPSSPLAPDIALSSANGRAVGLLTAGLMNSSGQVGTGGTFDGIVTLNARVPFQFDRSGGIAANRFDAQQSIEHEIDEILGLGSFLPRTVDALGNSAVKPEDLFRYAAPGINSLTASSLATSYFSIDGGVTNLIGFNQGPTGDYGDWSSPPCTTPYVQYAFSCRGTMSDVSATSPEGIALDVIGYDRAVPEPNSIALFGIGLFGLWVLRSRKFMRGFTAPSVIS